MQIQRARFHNQLIAIRHCFLFAFAFLLLTGCSSGKKEIPVQAKDFCSEIHLNDINRDSIQIPILSDPRKSGVYVLEDGGTSLVARAWLSEHASQTIDVQYFIFSTDNVGLIACDYLVRAADRGVKVRILVDDLLVDAGVHEILTLDSHPNIEIKIYNPGVNLGKNIVGKLKTFATDFRNANQRMHNKTFTVDSKVVITGGRNIADEYFDFDHEYNFRDRDIMIFGKAVNDVQSSFGKFWSSDMSVPIASLVNEDAPVKEDTARFERLHQYACNPENFWPQVREKIRHLPETFVALQQSGGVMITDSVSFISDLPGKNDGTSGLGGSGVTTDSLAALVRRAKKSIDIQSPYLITTERGRTLFADAIKRGVKIRIMTNSLASTDNLEAFNGYQRDRAALLKTGVRIFEFRPDAKERYSIMTGDLQRSLDYKPIFGLHAKTMVIDGNVTIIGTFNLDPRSANLNTECVTVVRSAKIAAGVLKGMETEFLPENSWETTSESNPDHEAGIKKRTNAMSKRVVPKGIL